MVFVKEKKKFWFSRALDTSVGKNGADAFLFYSDTSTRAHVETKGGNVNMKACSLKCADSSIPETDETKALYDKMWECGVKLADIGCEHRKMEIKEAEEQKIDTHQKRTLSIAEQKQQLIIDRKEGKISEEEYQEQAQELMNMLINSSQ